MRNQPSVAPAPVRRRSLDDVEVAKRYRFLTWVMGGGVEVSAHRKKRDPVTPVRVPAIRGQLRFWWRACNPRSCSTIADLRREEASIWGSTDSPSKIIIDVVRQPAPPHEVAVHQYNDRGRLVVIAGKEAIAYGAFPLQPSREHQQQREAPGTLFDYGEADFEIRLRFPHALETDVRTALGAWESFGGLGGRTRRGFGAIAGIPQGSDDQLSAASFLAGIGEPPAVEGLPGLVPGALHLGRYHHSSAIDAWKEGLAILQHVRQGPKQGRNPPAPGSRSPAGRSRWPEPDEIRRLTRKVAPKHAVPSVSVQKFPRAKFGLPIVFHFHPGTPGDPDSLGDPKFNPLTLRPRDYERLASPLIIRPIAAGAEFRAGALLLRAPLPPLVLEAGTHAYSVDAHLDPLQAAQVPALAGHAGPIEVFLAELTK